MASQIERILILAKTYPSLSAPHVETSCVAGINEHGAMRRLYAVPFRLIEEGQKLKKWQWVEVRVEKANRDHRTESHKLYVDTITWGDVIDGDRLRCAKPNQRFLKLFIKRPRVYTKPA